VVAENALTVVKPRALVTTFEDVGRAAQYFFASGMFPDIKDQAQAAVKIMAGQELGVGPFAAMRGIYIIKGQIALSANLMAALVKRSGRYDYRIKRLDNEAAVLEIIDSGQVAYTSTFTLEDAKAAGVGGDNWRRFPRNMLFARALSNGTRWVCPHVLMGAYVPEELGGDMGDDDMVVAEAAQPVIADVGTGEILPANGHAWTKAEQAQFVDLVFGEGDGRLNLTPAEVKRLIPAVANASTIAEFSALGSVADVIALVRERQAQALSDGADENA